MYMYMCMCMYDYVQYITKLNVKVTDNAVCLHMIQGAGLMGSVVTKVC